MDAEEVDEVTEIPYPMSNPTQIDLRKILKNSELVKIATEIHINKFKEVIQRNRTVFSSDPGHTHLVEMYIELLNQTPMRGLPYRMRPRQTKILSEEIRKLLDLEAIEQVEKVSFVTFITVMGLTKGYFQMPLIKKAQRYTATVTPFGVFLYKVVCCLHKEVMMFGLLNALSYFCKLISIFIGGLELFALPHIDDIAVLSLT